MSERHEENRAKAERWLRVAAEMEAGRLAYIEDTSHAHKYRRFVALGPNGRHEHGPDPLTAAERALGITDAS